MNPITKFAAVGIGSAAIILAVPAAASASANNAHFTAQYFEYTDTGIPVLWTCAGEHIDNNGAGIKEEETCALSGPGTASYVPGTYSGNPAGTFPGYPGTNNNYWYSDYNGQLATSYTVTVNGSSTRVHVEATYAS